MGQAHCKDSTFWVKSKNEIRRGLRKFRGNNWVDS